MFVQCFECIQKLLEYVKGLRLCEKLLVFELMLECLSVAVLVHKVVVVLRFQELDELDDVHAFNFGQHPDFIDRALL